MDAKVADTLAQMCKEIPNLPKVEEKKCEAVVQNNTAEFMKEMGMVIGTQLCKDVGFCAVTASDSSRIPLTHTPKKADPTVCDNCKKIVEEMQEVVVDVNSTYNAQLERFIDDRVCPSLPKQYQKDCVSYVHTALPEVWDTIINDFFSPVEACSAMGLCTETADVKERLSAHENPVDCKMCKQATRLIATKYFENPAVENQVALQLAKVCDTVPKASAEIKAKCVAQINEDTPALMKEMGEALRLHFCVEAKICTV